MNRKNHWEKAYLKKPPETLGWYRLHLKTSFTWIRELSLSLDAPIIDVGGGASTLVDDLLNAGYEKITVLDISEKALSSAKTRLGEKAEMVTWLGGDITLVDLPMHHYALWHDRAVFHFLTKPEHQKRYRDSLLNALKPDGHLIISTFAPEAPPKCSGLPVQRYSKEELENMFGEEFELTRYHKELHITPGGVEQKYLYCHFAKQSNTYESSGVNC